MTAEQIAGDLGSALQRFEWKRADELCAGLMRAILSSGDAMPPVVVNILHALRRKRRFHCMTRLGEALIYRGQGTPFIRRQYAQALIDRGLLVAAEHVLRDALGQAGGSAEAFELQGLMGRVLKQWYVTTPSGQPRHRRETLQRAVDWYMQAYSASPEKNYWQGINAVALLERGRRDGMDLSAARPALEIAEAILARLIASEREGTEPPRHWELATMMEALLALGRGEEMIQRAREYAAHPEVDAFEAASTLRQLEEVWNLSDEAPPGSSVVPLLRAKRLREEGGALTFAPGAIDAERQRAAQLELVHGFDGFQTLQWYRQGLERCSSVARIETETGRGLGTGWLVRAGGWLPHAPDETLLITNAHVISPSEQAFPGALLAGEAIANFQVLGTKVSLGSIVWSSPVAELDCSLVRLKTTPAAQPLPLAPGRVRTTTPPPRMYIIGFPGGRDLELSLQDNHLLGCNERVLHYRTPTEGGSSGSPVFDSDWRVVGLHHAGDSQLERLDGQPGTYEANEGILLTALLAKLKSED